jgi:hypothetical protein
MTYKFLAQILLLLLISAYGSQGARGQDRLSRPNKALMQRIIATEGLVAFWKFDERAGRARKAKGMGIFPLQEAKGEIARIKEGPVSGYAIELDGTNFLSLPNAEIGALNLFGEEQEITVLAWVKWTGGQTGFLGGMWNEYLDGGKRQYGLFLSLPYYNGGDQVCGHISRTGKPTPPFPYSIDYSASKQQVPADEWTCVAFTYDGQHIKSYVNGEFRARESELIRHTTGFAGYPEGITQRKNPYYFPHGMGNNGSDFTVGAVLLKKGMGNFYRGLLGGLVVYERALSEEEMKQLVGGEEK